MRSRRAVEALVAGAAAAALAWSPAADAAPAATVTPAAGPPGASVRVTGAGFDPSTSLDVFLDTTNVAVATSDATGAVGVTLTVPMGAQPGQHWVTLDERHGTLAAQVGFFQRVDWPQTGYVPSGRRSNPLENTLTTDNVGGLTRAWSTAGTGVASIVEYQTQVYGIAANGHVTALRPNGTLLWTANVPSSFPRRAPVAYNGRVFFASGNGLVSAFGATCRSDGGVCTPVWTHSVGTGITGDLTQANGWIYAPSSDRTVHALNPNTGVEGAALPATASTAGAPAVSHAPIFTGDGGHWYVAGSWIGFSYPGNVGAFDLAEGPLSGLASLNGNVFFAGQSRMHLQGTVGTDAPLAATGCPPPAPAVARGRVFTAGCAELDAFDATDLSTLWTSPLSSVTGLAEANGVLYACGAFRIAAFDARFGDRLWTGGPCDGEPIVANGRLYTSGGGHIDVYDLTTGLAARHRRAGVRRPDPRRLHPDPRLHAATGRRA